MNLAKAIEIQRQLAQRLILEWRGGPVRTVAGADFAYSPDGGRIGAAIIVLSFPDLHPVEIATAVRNLEMPYIPGFLSLREGPAFVAAFGRLRHPPDVTILDGNGIAHPRKMGLASYVGVSLDIPTIGCAKTPFFPFREPRIRAGAWTVYRDRHQQKVGICLRTRAGVRPVFVSPGHRVDFRLARQIVMACSRYRLPEPLREAHQLARRLVRSSDFQEA